jgi:hypothetical protein
MFLSWYERGQAPHGLGASNSLVAWEISLLRWQILAYSIKGPYRATGAAEVQRGVKGNTATAAASETTADGSAGVCLGGRSIGEQHPEAAAQIGIKAVKAASSAARQ